MTAPILQMKILGQPALGSPARVGVAVLSGRARKDPKPLVPGAHTLTTTLCGLCVQGLRAQRIRQAASPTVLQRTRGQGALLTKQGRPRVLILLRAEELSRPMLRLHLGRGSPLQYGVGTCC